MFRWIRGTIWVTGTCILSCPLCVCISGGGSWWVCACTVGLISVTMVSGYTTWTIFNQLLNESGLDTHFLARYLTFQTTDNNEKEKTHISAHIDPSFLEREISETAQAFHSHLVLPWYSHISPDDKYSLQIRSTLEDLLTGVFKNLKQHIDLSVLFQEILILYLQHYRQFYRALRKISQKAKKRPLDCAYPSEEILETYKAIHPALKSKDGVHLHCRRLAHLLLINYLPSEVTRCDLLFVCVRDLFAQNLLHSVLEVFCDGVWLNEAIIEALSPMTGSATEASMDAGSSQGDMGETSPSENGVSSSSSDIDQKEGRAYSYTHSLSAIREETSLEVMDLDPSSSTTTVKGGAGGAQLKQSEAGVANQRPRGSPSGGESPAATVAPPLEVKGDLSTSTDTVQGPHALLEYVQSSSLERDSSESSSSRSVATALGDLISTTAVPLLPDTATFPPSQPPPSLKMWWKGPSEEKVDRGPPKVKPKPPIGKKNPFKKVIIEGMTESDYKKLRRRLTDESTNQTSPMVQCCISSESNSQKRSSHDSHDSHISSSCIRKEDNSLLNLKKSRSLSSLSSKLENEVGAEEGLHCSSKLSISTEAIPRCWCSLDETENEAKSRLGKANKGQLQKMNSFDRNDGTDEFSLTWLNFTASSECTSSADGQRVSVEEPPPRASAKEQQKDLYAVSISPPSTSSSSSTLVSSATGETGDRLPPPESLDLALSPLEEERGGPFGWDNAPPDLSPIYEESENLASTIAKLRCLLSERQSQHSLGSQSSFGSSESEPKSAQSDPGRYSLEKARFTFFHKDSSGSLASIKSTSSTDSSHYCFSGAEEDILEASDIPIDGKVFVNVSIPTTEVHSEAAGFHYTMYLVQYDAIYLSEVVTPTASEVTPAGGDITPSGGQHKMMLQTNVVKRRFREFLTLHSALEEDVSLRAAMKGIKGPNKWLNLPFSKLDSATISSRKQFLEKYLQALIQRPLLNTSSALKDFLAYGSDSNIAFVKKPLEINVPRLDKLFARTVSGVFHSLKTALPNFDSTDPPLQGGGASGVASIQAGVLSEGASLTDKDRPLWTGFLGGIQGDFDVRLDITAEEQVCEMEDALLAAITASSELSSPVEAGLDAARDLRTPEPNDGPPPPLSLLSAHPVSFFPKPTALAVPPTGLNSLLPEEGGRGENASGPSGGHFGSVYPASPHLNPLSTFWSEIGLAGGRDHHQLQRQDSQESLGGGDVDAEGQHPLFWAIVDLIVEIVGSSDNFLTRRGATLLISRLWAKQVSEFLQMKLGTLVCEEVIQIFFERIKSCISPSVSSTTSSFPPNAASANRQQSSKERLQTTLARLIPSIFDMILGKETVNDSVSLFVESLQHPVLKQDLGLHLIDLLFVHLLLPV